MECSGAAWKHWTPPMVQTQIAKTTASTGCLIFLQDGGVLALSLHSQRPSSCCSRSVQSPLSEKWDRHKPFRQELVSEVTRESTGAETDKNTSRVGASAGGCCDGLFPSPDVSESSLKAPFLKL